MRFSTRAIRQPRPLLAALAAVWLLAFSAAAHAERYRVDLIVFADKTGSGGEK